MPLRLRGQTFVVVGLGRSGRSAIELCLREGARVRATDERSFADFGELLESLVSRGVTFELGGFRPRFWEGADAVVVSPGVPLSLPAMAEARSAGARVMGEIEFACQLLPRPYVEVGITGTNGKSTTTALVGELFAKAGRRAFVGGNLGRPLSDAVGGKYDAHVVELSSFQLEGIESARFKAAAVLNLTPDHLDRYPSHADYGAAKARIWENQAPSDVAVVNADDAVVMALADAAPGKRYGFTLGSVPVDSRKLSGLAAPCDGGFLLEWSGSERFRLANRALRGAHNLANAMAAALLARVSGVSAAAVQQGLDSFPGLSHRLEWVRTRAGVEWVNDSKATNVDSSVMALRALPGPIWLIAGGRGKGAPYAPMVEASRGKLRGVLAIGEDAQALEAAFSKVCEVHRCGTLAVAVARARALALDGEVVLLSPACASYDQFKNFEERGDAFKNLVREP